MSGKREFKIRQQMQDNVHLFNGVVQMFNSVEQGTRTQMCNMWYKAHTKWNDSN